MTLQTSKRRFTVEEYYRMVETGILSGQDRVELVDGAVFQMAAMGSRHSGCIMGLISAIVPAAKGRYLVTSQTPVRLGAHSEPQPDLSVLRGRGDRCCQSHPTAADVFLLVEVADSSVDFDRGVKLPLYGRHGIPEVWLVELNAETIEVHRKPRAGSFEETRRCRRGETLVPAALPDLVLRVDELLG